MSKVSWSQLSLHLFGTVAAMVSAVWWLSSTLHAVDSRLIRIEAQTRARWTAQDMKVWSTQLDGLNPTIDVPDPWRVVDHRLPR